MYMNRELARLIRHSYDMTTYEFAEMIGVSLSSYTNFETGYSNSSYVQERFIQTVNRAVIIEAEKLLRLTNAAKGVKAL